MSEPKGKKRHIGIDPPEWCRKRHCSTLRRYLQVGEGLQVVGIDELEVLEGNGKVRPTKSCHAIEESPPFARGVEPALPASFERLF